MTKDQMIAELKQKEELKNKTEMIFHQLTGQIAMLRELINREKTPEVEAPKE